MAVSRRPRCTSLCWLSASGQIGDGEGGDVVLFRLSGDGLVLGAVAQAHQQFLVESLTTVAEAAVVMHGRLPDR